MKLKSFLNFSVNNPEAHFWIVRVGDAETVGTPTREFSPEHIGVTISQPDIAIPEFMFYYMEYLKKVGALSPIINRSANFHTINIKDLGEFTLRT